MRKIITKGQLLLGIAIGASGVENLICAHRGLAVRGVPWFPVNSHFGYITGIVLIAAGLSLAVNFGARLTATLLGTLFVSYVLFFEVPAVVAKPLSVSVRTVFFETLAISASALTLARTLPQEGTNLHQWDGVLNKLFSSGRFLFGASSVVFGIDHFLVLAVIASLIPPWIPGAAFWAPLTGAAFIAAGISILTKWMDQLSAFLLGTMFLLWFLVLHLPRSVNTTLSHDPNIQNEWSSAFIALAMCGSSWIVANHARHRRAT